MRRPTEISKVARVLMKRIINMIPVSIGDLIKWSWLQFQRGFSVEFKVSEWGQRLVISSFEEAMSSNNFTILAHVQRYVFVASHLRNLHVLDCGAGTGYGSYYLATHGARDVVAIDIGKKAMSYAKRHFEARNLSYRVMNALNLEFEDESFDAVISFDVLEHIFNQIKLVAEIARVLKPNGILIIGTPNAMLSHGANPHHVKELSLKEFSALLHNYFKEVRILGQDLLIQGRRMKQLWYIAAGRKLSLNNFVMVEEDVEHVFGLLAICKK